MTDIRAKLTELYSLEQLSAGDTCIHRLHPGAKLAATAVFLLCVASFGRYEAARLVPYFFYPFLLLALSEVPLRMLASRVAVALPFALFAGLTGLLFDRTPAAFLGSVPISGGAIILGSILLRTVLCVSAILLLMAVTPFRALADELRRIHCPPLFLTLLEMTYRYIGTLVAEAANMWVAYHLRAPGQKNLALNRMGSFIGQLFLRSVDRAERVYHAMKCRGYSLGGRRSQSRPFRAADWIFLACVGGGSILFRFLDVPAFAAALAGGLL
jgi:cobalt/nickel transport system permease protein